MSEDILPDGRKIAARAKAMINGPSDGKPYPARTVDELLLEDGSVVFQCVFPLPDGEPPCDYLADNAHSVTAHSRKHGGKILAKRLAAKAAEAEERLAVVQAQLDQRKHAASERAVKAAKTRNEKRAQNVTQSKLTPSTQQGHVLKSIDEMFTRIREELDKMSASMIPLAQELARLQQEVNKLPSADPDIITKAAEFDRLRNIFKAE